MWAKEYEEHQKEVLSMKKEIEKLQEKKLQALIPIEIYKAEADRKMKIVQEGLENVQKKEDAVEEMKDILEDKLDEVGEKMVNLSGRERSLQLKELSAKQQESVLISNNKKLTQQMLEFVNQREQALKDIDSRMTAVLLKERTLEERADSLKRTEKSLEVWAKQLKDRQETFERSVKRGEVIPIVKPE